MSCFLISDRPNTRSPIPQQTTIAPSQLTKPDRLNSKSNSDRQSLQIKQRSPKSQHQTEIATSTKSLDKLAKIYGMDVYFVLNGIKFVWNEEKARINPINHDGVTFQQATEAFFDPFLVVVDASRNEEERDTVIGLDKRWNLLYVVYVERENDLVLIISARKATRKEHEYYEN